MSTYGGRNHCGGPYSLNSPQRCKSNDIWIFLKKLEHVLGRNFCSLFENADAKVNTAKTAVPNINAFFLPYTSATLPETSSRQP